MRDSGAHLRNAPLEDPEAGLWVHVPIVRLHQSWGIAPERQRAGVSSCGHEPAARAQAEGTHCPSPASGRDSTVVGTVGVP